MSWVEFQGCFKIGDSFLEITAIRVSAEKLNISELHFERKIRNLFDLETKILFLQRATCY